MAHERLSGGARFAEQLFHVVVQLHASGDRAPQRFAAGGRGEKAFVRGNGCQGHEQRELCGPQEQLVGALSGRGGQRKIGVDVPREACVDRVGECVPHGFPRDFRRKGDRVGAPLGRSVGREGEHGCAGVLGEFRPGLRAGRRPPVAFRYAGVRKGFEPERGRPFGLQQGQLFLHVADGLRSGEVEVCVVAGGSVRNDRLTVAVGKQQSLSACFDVAVSRGGNGGGDGEHEAEPAAGEFVGCPAEVVVKVAVETPLAGGVLPAVGNEQDAGRIAACCEGVGSGEQSLAVRCGGNGGEPRVVKEGEGKTRARGVLRPGVFVYAVEVGLAQRPAAFFDDGCGAGRHEIERLTVETHLYRIGAPHDASEAGDHERGGAAYATVGRSLPEGGDEGSRRPSFGKEPPPFFVAERFETYVLRGLRRGDGREERECDCEEVLVHEVSVCESCFVVLG